MKRDKRLGSRGFSLVELIIVVAILAALVGILTYSLSLIFSTQASRCANSIDAILSQTKIDAMSREGGASVRIYTDASGSVMEEYTIGGAVQTTEKIGDSRCSVTYTRSAAGSAALDSTGLIISFVRGTGAFDFTKNTGWADAETCTQIVVSGGTRTYTITLYPATGGHTLGG